MGYDDDDKFCMAESWGSAGCPKAERGCVCRCWRPDGDILGLAGAKLSQVNVGAYLTPTDR